MRFDQYTIEYWTADLKVWSKKMTSSVAIIIILACSVLSTNRAFADSDLYLPKNVENCIITFEKVVTTTTNQLKLVPHGTGFIIKDASSEERYIVTNRHVLENRDSIWVRFNKIENDSVVGARFLLTLVNNNRITWSSHPDTSIDVAIMSAPRNISLFTIPTSRFKDFEKVRLGDPILFLGFPLLEAAIGNINYPLVRSGIVSFKTVNDLLNPRTKEVIVQKRHIIVDAVVMSGNSGSPVLSTPKKGSNKMSIIGVLSAHLFKLNSTDDLQLGICIPSERIQETIDEYKSLKE